MDILVYNTGKTRCVKPANVDKAGENTPCTPDHNPAPARIIHQVGCTLFQLFLVGSQVFCVLGDKIFHPHGFRRRMPGGLDRPRRGNNGQVGHIVRVGLLQDVKPGRSQRATQCFCTVVVQMFVDKPFLNKVSTGKKRNVGHLDKQQAVRGHGVADRLQ